MRPRVEKRPFSACAVILLVGCASAEPTATATPSTALQKQCAPDEYREYRCEDLLPLTSSLPAPEPYESCPGYLEIPSGARRASSVSAFDPAYTAYIRSRMPPGHSCCYSSCTALELVDKSEVAPNAGCEQQGMYLERYCMLEPESGSSEPAPSPFGRCPLAIKPQSDRVFSQPKGAILHPGLSDARRREGFRDCCYAWCAAAPPGSGLQSAQ
jgi:hypothetical protein